MRGGDERRLAQQEGGEDRQEHEQAGEEAEEGPAEVALHESDEAEEEGVGAAVAELHPGADAGFSLRGEARAHQAAGGSADEHAGDGAGEDKGGNPGDGAGAGAGHGDAGEQRGRGDGEHEPGAAAEEEVDQRGVDEVKGGGQEAERADGAGALDADAGVAEQDHGDEGDEGALHAVGSFEDGEERKRRRGDRWGFVWRHGESIARRAGTEGPGFRGRDTSEMMRMRRLSAGTTAGALWSASLVAEVRAQAPAKAEVVVEGKPVGAVGQVEADSTAENSVTVGGQKIAYKAYGRNETYNPGAYTEATFTWEMKHQAPGGASDGGALNVMPDLAYTMKNNPTMRVMVAGGYYDLATPFFEGMYEMRHLQIPEKLQGNTTYKYYESGHMVYVNEGVLKRFHDDVAAFVKGTEAGK